MQPFISYPGNVIFLAININIIKISYHGGIIAAVYGRGHILINYPLRAFSYWKLFPNTV